MQEEPEGEVPSEDEALQKFNGAKSLAVFSIFELKKDQKLRQKTSFSIYQGQKEKQKKFWILKDLAALFSCLDLTLCLNVVVFFGKFTLFTYFQNFYVLSFVEILK